MFRLENLQRLAKYLLKKTDQVYFCYLSIPLYIFLRIFFVPGYLKIKMKTNNSPCFKLIIIKRGHFH